MNTTRSPTNIHKFLKTAFPVTWAAVTSVISGQDPKRIEQEVLGFSRRLMLMNDSKDSILYYLYR